LNLHNRRQSEALVILLLKLSLQRPFRGNAYRCNPMRNTIFRTESVPEGMRRSKRAIVVGVQSI
jgi:hypothetical protein